MKRITVSSVRAKEREKGEKLLAEEKKAKKIVKEDSKRKKRIKCGKKSEDSSKK